jgi:hypothetical protein
MLQIAKSTKLMIFEILLIISTANDFVPVSDRDCRETNSRIARMSCNISAYRFIGPPKTFLKPFSTRKVESGAKNDMRPLKLIKGNMRRVCALPRHRFINLLCDAGTVKIIKVVHCAISNPTRLCEILPLEAYENDGWTVADYESFFTETVTDLYQRGSPEIEICGIMSDNLPAQINSISSFLSVEGGPGSGIMHVPCLNQMISPVFSCVT